MKKKIGLEDTCQDCGKLQHNQQVRGLKCIELLSQLEKLAPEEAQRHIKGIKKIIINKM